MRFKHVVPLGLLAALFMGVAVNPAEAQDAAAGGAPKIVTANVIRIFTEMQETKDLQAKWDKDRNELTDQGKAKAAALQQIKSERDNLKPGSPQYQTKSDDYLKGQIDLQAWTEGHKADIAHRQKVEMRSLYQKIEQAVKEIAETNNYDLVLAEEKPIFPDDIDQITIENLRMFINQRNVLFEKRSIDITQQVIATLDAKYTKN